MCHTLHWKFMQGKKNQTTSSSLQLSSSSSSSQLIIIFATITTSTNIINIRSYHHHNDNQLITFIQRHFVAIRAFGIVSKTSRKAFCYSKSQDQIDGSISEKDLKQTFQWILSFIGRITHLKRCALVLSPSHGTNTGGGSKIQEQLTK